MLNAITNARPRVGHHAQNTQVLLGDRLVRVDEQDRDLSGLDRALRTQRRIELRSAGMADALAQTSRVDETPRAPAEFDDGVDRVDGCAGNVVHDGPLVTGQLVEQAGLSDVRLSDESNTTRAAAGDTFTRGFRQLLENLVEQVAGTAAVGRTHGVRLTEAQGPQCCNLGLGASVVHLVGKRG